MTQDEFQAKYESEIPMFQAWGNFILNYIINELKLKLGHRYYDYIKAPPTNRVKTTDSIITKAFITKKDKYKDPYNEITDKVGARFVVLLTDQLKLLQEIIENCDSWKYSRDRDFDHEKELNPQIFDYQSIHYVLTASKDFEYNGVAIKENTPCEVQLRTLLQHAYAELAHDTIYKGEVKVSSEVRRIFAKSMALMETTDELMVSAKSKLENATYEQSNWSNKLIDIYITRVNEQYTPDTKTIDFYLDSLSEIVKRTSIEKLLEFEKDCNNNFIFERIKEKSKSYIDFRHASIVLIYFLAAKFRSRLKKSWPIDDEILKMVFSDMGISTDW